ncbi:MFS transporter [Candidatus Peregrinibacteria bacterium]|nr:MFS transporter [Candidatus Peregrinibacteria bacterium]
MTDGVESSTKLKMPRAIWALGLGSLFMDTSSEIVHGLLPVFLVSVLGASITSVGVLEGLAEAATLILKVISGPVSDFFGRRKPLVILGYTIGALSKPLFALANSVSVVYGARLMDRIGKGIRGAPRDALVADLSPVELRGRAFGLRQSLDTVGAFLGPMLAIILMCLTHNDYQTVFWLATIPGLLCVTVLFFGIHEEGAIRAHVGNRSLHVGELKKFPPTFWFIVAGGALFQLARFSEAFLILRAKDFGLGLELAPLVLIIMNLAYSLSAYPVGHFSDRFRREWFLLVGLIVLCLSDLALGLGRDLLTIFGGVVLWGLYMGLTQGTLAVLVADTCPSSFRGTAYGVFNLFSAGALLAGNAIAGVLWDRVGPKSTFLVGATFSFLGFLMLLSTRSIWTKPLHLNE